MKTFLLLNYIIFALSVISILLVFIINPAALWLRYQLRSRKRKTYGPSEFSVSLIIVVHNAEDLIVKKIENALSLDFPTDDYEILVFSDGSTDATVVRAGSVADPHVKVEHHEENEGKRVAMNKAALSAKGELLVFSDVDAIIEKGALKMLSRHFGDPGVGGVCAQRVISKGETDKIAEGQRSYVGFDSLIKKFESETGSLTSNDGKLYCVRRSLYREIPDAVTDDLFVCLAVIEQGFRFIFEPSARALVRLPSKSSAHEMSRRRRIVSTSLRGIFMFSSLFNPFVSGAYGPSLFINKVLRRFLPVSFVLLLVTSFILSHYSLPILIFFFLQLVCYIMAWLHSFTSQHFGRIPLFSKLFSASYYFTLGLYGTWLGLVDLALGRKLSTWKAHKE